MIETSTKCQPSVLREISNGTSSSSSWAPIGQDSTESADYGYRMHLPLLPRGTRLNATDFLHGDPRGNPYEVTSWVTSRLPVPKQGFRRGAGGVHRDEARGCAENTDKHPLASKIQNWFKQKATTQIS